MNPCYWGWGKMMYLCKKQVGENMNLWPRTKKIYLVWSRLEVLSLSAVMCFKQNGCQMKNRSSVTVPVITIWIFSFLSLWYTCKTPSEGGEQSWAVSLAVWRNDSGFPFSVRLPGISPHNPRAWQPLVAGAPHLWASAPWGHRSPLAVTATGLPKCDFFTDPLF